MPLQKIKDFDSNYQSFFEDHDIIGYDLYTGADNEKVGTVDDLLVDDTGRFRYFVVNTGAWIFGKKVLLPLGRARITHTNRRVSVDGLTKDQVERLPEYDGNLPVDFEHEERVRDVYRSGAAVQGQPAVATPNPLAGATYDRNNYTYDRDPDLYNMTDRNHENLRLYEERLIANKARQKTGEVVVGKRVEAENVTASVPVERERVVVERVDAVDIGMPVTPGADAFQEGQVACVEIYEEVPDIHKETVVREEVNVRKEIDRETVEANEQVRRERLDVRTDGTPTPVVEKQPRDLD
jgi:uncharacterized protein (TIGR02271 family)